MESAVEWSKRKEACHSYSVMVAFRQVRELTVGQIADSKGNLVTVKLLKKALHYTWSWHARTSHRPPNGIIIPATNY